MLVCDLFSLYVVMIQAHVSVSQDIEIEGVLKMGKDFMDRIKNGISISDLPLPTDIAFRQSDQIFIPYKQEINNQSVSGKLVNFFKQYRLRLWDKGVKQLRTLAFDTTRELDVTDDVTAIVEQVVDEYNMKFKQYINESNQQKADFKEFMFLDAVDSFTHNLFGSKRSIVNRIGVKNEQIDVKALHKVMSRVYEESVFTKRDELDYLCETIKVCHVYPGFSDYVVDIISEVLTFSDGKLIDFINELTHQLEAKSSFFETIIDKDVVSLMRSRVESMKSIEDVRVLLALIRSVVTQRYKVIKTKDPQVRVRTKSARLLIQLIDRAFGEEDDDILSFSLESVVKSLTLYKTGMRDDLKTILSTFVNHMVGILNHNLERPSKEHVKILTEIVMKGSAKDKVKVGQMFSRRSLFVNQ